MPATSWTALNKSAESAPGATGPSVGTYGTRTTGRSQSHRKRIRRSVPVKGSEMGPNTLGVGTHSQVLLHMDCHRRRCTSTYAILRARRDRPRTRSQRLEQVLDRFRQRLLPFHILLSFTMLAIGNQWGLDLPIELNERHADAACPLKLTAGAPALSQQQTVCDSAEPPKTGYPFKD